MCEPVSVAVHACRRAGVQARYNVHSQACIQHTHPDRPRLTPTLPTFLLFVCKDSMDRMISSKEERVCLWTALTNELVVACIILLRLQPLCDRVRLTPHAWMTRSHPCRAPSMSDFAIVLCFCTCSCLSSCFIMFISLTFSNVVILSSRLASSLAFRPCPRILFPTFSFRAVIVAVCPVQPGQKVAILGAGPIGLVAMMVAKAFGASATVITDVSDERLKVATDVRILDFSTFKRSQSWGATRTETCPCKISHQII